MGYKIMFSEITPYLPAFLKGLEISIIISVVGMLIGSFIGVLAASGRTSSVYIVNKLVNVYVEIFRNTPLLIQMYLLYFGLGQFDIQISPFISATLALILNVGAYTAVIFQTGINAVHKEQQEAAYTLGMTSFQTFRYVILPQAFRIVIPPLTNQFISVFLFSSVASTISVRELTYITMNVESITMRTFEVFIITAALYLIVTTVISLLSSVYERSYKY
jgi:polar amino acid transport system permease protein